MTGNQTTLRTDGNGTFIANDAALSFLAFEPAEACVDTLLGVPVGCARACMLQARHRSSASCSAGCLLLAPH